MRYSLSSRFQGTLLGSILAANINKKQQKQQNISAQIAPLVAKSLIKKGRLDIDFLTTAFAQELLISKNSTSAIVATLPIAFFYHENEIKLRKNLLIFIDIWQPNLLIRDCSLAIGYAIAQSFNQKLDAANLIPQVIDFLGESPSQLPQYLTQVQTLLAQKASLEKVITQLGYNNQLSTAIALAFYCFLSTLEDWRLSVMRAVKSSAQMTELVPILTGALSGTHNSLAGIPATLNMALSQPENDILTAWGINSTAEILEICDALVAVWSGVYDPAIHPTDLIRGSAIAAPRIIKAR